MALISNGSTIFDAGSMSAGFGGSMVFIKKLTASSSATLSFVDGTDGVVLDDTYKEYLFTFNNMHPQTDTVNFTFQCSTDGGSNYNTTVTSTAFQAYHQDSDADDSFGYNTSVDQAQETDFTRLQAGAQIGNGNDECLSGTFTIFNPSSTTFVKHWISVTQLHDNNTTAYSVNCFLAGYYNTTSAIDAIQFKMDSGNIDAGDICLYGIA
jgi:hypothetical protein